MTAIGTAGAGITAAMGRFDRSASTIAGYGATADEGDLARAVVDQVSAEMALKANVAVVRTADAMTKRLLDITA